MLNVEGFVRQKKVRSSHRMESILLFFFQSKECGGIPASHLTQVKDTNHCLPPFNLLEGWILRRNNANKRKNNIRM